MKHEWTHSINLIGAFCSDCFKETTHKIVAYNDERVVPTIKGVLYKNPPMLIYTECSECGHEHMEEI